MFPIISKRRPMARPEPVRDVARACCVADPGTTRHRISAPRSATGCPPSIVSMKSASASQEICSRLMPRIHKALSLAQFLPGRKSCCINAADRGKLRAMLFHDAIRTWQTSAAALLVAFLLLAWSMLDSGKAAAQQQEAPATALSAVSNNAPAALSLDRLSATRERPLFSPSRRPPPPVTAFRALAPPPPPPPPPKPAPSLVLFGTFESNEEIGAIVQIGKDKPTIMRFGTYIDGWRVTEISNRRVVLSLGDRKTIFSLFGKEPETPQTVRLIAKSNEPQPQSGSVSGSWPK
jgi:hypothetical protein